MKRRTWCLMLLALLLIAAAAVSPAIAYFTTYTRSAGGYTIHLGAQTEIEEGWDDWTKLITITNTEGEDVFVRVHAYWGETYPATVSSSGGWFEGADGWWYYGTSESALTPLAEGQTATGLSVKVSNIPAGLDESQIEEGDNFNVVVVYESTPVQYDESGAAFADWTMTLVEGGQS